MSDPTSTFHPGEDAPQRGLVHECRARHHMLAVAASGGACAHDEVLVEPRPLRGLEFVVRVGVLSNHVVVRARFVYARRRAQQRQAEHPVLAPCGHATSHVGAVGMPEQQHRPLAQVIDEVAEQRHHVVVAAEPLGRRAAHPRQIRIDPPVSLAGNDGLDRRLDLAMINTGAVQRNERHAAAVLDVMDPDFVDPALHLNPHRNDRCRPASRYGFRDILGSDRVEGGSGRAYVRSRGGTLFCERLYGDRRDTRRVRVAASRSEFPCRRSRRLAAACELHRHGLGAVQTPSLAMVDTMETSCSGVTPISWPMARLTRSIFGATGSRA